jgi:hypothetical protein
MKRFDVRAIGGILLILVGILLLLQNLGVLEVIVALVWALLFAAGGLVFLYMFLTERTRQWWAVIPGGVLLTLALITALSPVFEGAAMGGVFFLGLGLTFALLYFLPTPHAQMKWALIPAAVLGVMGVLITLAATGGLAYLGAAVMILVGLYLLFRLFVSR